MKTVRLKQQGPYGGLEYKDEALKEKEEIQNEKEELHEIYDYLTSKNKNNNKKNETGTSTQVNLHELVR